MDIYSLQWVNVKYSYQACQRLLKKLFTNLSIISGVNNTIAMHLNIVSEMVIRLGKLL
jgi:hypothetical protein